jgi:hypothetical protein
MERIETLFHELAGTTILDTELTPSTFFGAQTIRRVRGDVLRSFIEIV